MSEQSTVNDRLTSLPAKVNVPFRRLLQVGQIDEDAVSTILDAGELAGDSSRLLAFAAGFLHLKAQGIPVNDVVRMAKQQQRRINLGWSATRWKAEHNRLARAETLQRLAAENVAYDVSKFEALLPARFPGYLIRSSQRLGMEGLRQHHCVAGYHHQVQKGHCAIAAVFVGRHRWTVQLLATSVEDVSLRIVQIKTRHNGLPSREVRDRIHEVLGIEFDNRVAVPVVRRGTERTYLGNLRRILPVLREYDVATVYVGFDGCGDSGSIHTVRYDPDDFDGNAIEVDVVTITSRHEAGGWVSNREVSRQSVDKAVEELTYDYLEETDVDWYNNDGGYGELEIDVEEGSVSLEVNVNYTDSNTEFNEQRDIESGEEL